MKQRVNQTKGTLERGKAGLAAEATIYVSAFSDQFVEHEGSMASRMNVLKGEILFTTVADPDVNVALVGRKLLVTYRDCDPTLGLMPDGQCRVVQATICIGFVNHEPEGGIRVCLWSMQHPDDSVLPKLRTEIMAWWAALPAAQRVELSKRFDNNPKVDW
jgi:hypothetical protein